jgi:hypothetical protein
VQRSFPVATRALRLAATIYMPSEAFICTVLRGKEVSFTTKVLADGCTAHILKEVEGPCAWIGIHVTGDDTSVLL